ncbi:hypothetical protein L1049_011151 [Liquidambar formosana]|uniref:2-isopropylmalate synthase n=1 Tax=Liquidambar formosana TaxID=63359 RepID=A0AAP0WZJ6_LIQFO
MNPSFSSTPAATTIFSLKTKQRPYSLSFNPSPHHTPKTPSFATIICSLQRRPRPEYVPNHISDPLYVRVFDTTLRDGEQSPGATMTVEQKLKIAHQLANLGVDIIEAGFPVSSNNDRQAVQLIAEEVGNTVDEDGHVPVICALARCSKNDIDAAWEAVKHARKPRIHTFIGTSNIHMAYKLNMTKGEVLEKATSMVRYARALGCNDVEFSPEDAGRADKEFLYQILGEVIKAGATTLNIADTVGYTVPREFGKLIADIKSNTPGIDNVIISTHCQNDLGQATANTIEGACAGARQIEVTINGIGERAGNAALEEVVMTLKCRGDDVLEGLYTGINTQRIVMASKMVEEYTGLYVQPHKAIVGDNAIARQTGVRQDVMINCKGRYQIIDPKDIGLTRDHEAGVALGKLSGRSALKERLHQLGYMIKGEELDDVFMRFKAVCEHKKREGDAYCMLRKVKA